MVTVFIRGAEKSALPVGKSDGKAQVKYPSVLNSLIGVKGAVRRYCLSE